MTHNGGRCQQKAQDGGQTAAPPGELLFPFQAFACLHLNVGALKVSEWAPAFSKGRENNTG